MSLLYRRIMLIDYVCSGGSKAAGCWPSFFPSVIFSVNKNRLAPPTITLLRVRLVRHSEEVGLTHNAHELVFVDLTIAIAVSLVDHFLNLFVGHVLSEFLGDASQIMEGDFACVVVVEKAITSSKRGRRRDNDAFDLDLMFSRESILTRLSSPLAMRSMMPNTINANFASSTTTTCSRNNNNARQRQQKKFPFEPSPKRTTHKADDKNNSTLTLVQRREEKKREERKSIQSIVTIINIEDICTYLIIARLRWFSLFWMRPRYKTTPRQILVISVGEKRIRKRTSRFSTLVTCCSKRKWKRLRVRWQL